MPPGEASGPTTVTPDRRHRRLRFVRQHVVHRLPAANDDPRPVVDEHFGWRGTSIVIRRHGCAIGAGVADRDQIAHFQRWQVVIRSERIATLAHRADDVVRGR